MRPVRLVPLAAGARPTTRICGSGSPKPGPGRPQYGWFATEARFPSVATSSRQRPSRGQARHTDTRADSSATDADPAARRRTCVTVLATGVCPSAGSPGHPVPGGTGEGNTCPVTGCGRNSFPKTSPRSGQREGDAVEDVMLRGDDLGYAGLAVH